MKFKTISLLFIGIILCMSAQVQSLAIEAEIPPPITPIESPDPLVNIVLLGSDTNDSRNVGRTDAIMLVSLNQRTGTISLLSIPRDLYVYIPDWQMNRINLVYAHGENNDIEGGGKELLRQTILYNLGIEIDHVARIDFNGFQQIIDGLGGVEITVDCAIQDWRLRDPSLNPHDEANWEQFTLPIGVHKMDGSLALWYVRSRMTSSDIDRGRRQQAVMRGVWRRVLELDLLDQVPDIWSQLSETVTTDLTLNDFLQYLPVALSHDASKIRTFMLRANHEIVGQVTPEGASVLMVNAEALRALMTQFVTPPATGQSLVALPSVEIVNASGVKGWDKVAAERLISEGFNVQIGAPSTHYQQYTLIYNYGTQAKDNALDRLNGILRLSPEAIISEPKPDRDVDFRVYIGGNYRSCAHNVMPPKPID